MYQLQVQHVRTQGKWDRTGKEGGQYGVLKVQAGPQSSPPHADAGSHKARPPERCNTALRAVAS